jgi:hypothetical protein
LHPGLLEAGDTAASAKAAHDEADAVGKAADALTIRLRTVAKQAEHIDAELAQAEYLMSAQSVQNRDELADKIKQNFKGRDVVLRSYVADHEGWGLCTQLWCVAQGAEMKPANECGLGQLTTPLASPLVISGPDLDETMKLGSLLNRIGGVGGWSGIKAQVLTIFVGVKSPFIIGQASPAPAKKATKKQTAKPLRCRREMAPVPLIWKVKFFGV